MKTDQIMNQIGPLTVFAVAIICRFGAALTADVHSGWLHNLAPVTAIALCGGLLFPRWVALWLPLAAFFTSDAVLNVPYSGPRFSSGLALRNGALVLIGLLGLALGAHPRFLTVVTAGEAASLLFYVVTNTGAWIAAPEYAGNLPGWVQAQTVGLPCFPPSWISLRSALTGDVGFAGAFIACLTATDRCIVPREFQPQCLY